MSISIPNIGRVVKGPSHLSGSTGMLSAEKISSFVARAEVHSCVSGLPTIMKSST